VSNSAPRHRDLVRTLLEHEVDFILIGGHAVGIHGYIRATKDVDVLPAPDPPNLERLTTALKAMEAKPEPIDIPEHGEALSAEWLAQGGNFIFQTNFGRVDVMQFIAGPDLTYEDLAAGAKSADFDGLPIKVCSYEDLVTMKEAAGRGQDAVDLERLREAHEEE
jgi:predicted nucleotidyltransferase